MADDKKTAVAAVKTAWALLSRARDLGADEDKCSQAERFMASARKAMKEGDFARAAQDAKKAQMIAHTVLAEADGGTDRQWMNQLKELTEFMKTAQDAIVEAKNAGMPTEDAERAFRDAVKAMEAKDYERSREGFVNAVAMLKGRSQEHSRVKDIVLQAELAVTDLKNMGIPVTSIEALVNRALIALDRGDYSEAVKLSEDILKQCIEVTEKGKKARDTIKRAEKIIKEAGEEGIEVRHLADELEVAKKAFEEKDFDQAEEIAGTLVKELTENISKHKEIAATVKWAHEKLEEIRKAGVDTTEWYSSFSEALNLATERRYDEALEKLRLIKEALEDIDRNTERIMELTEEIEKGQEEAVSLGIEVDYSDNLARAREFSSDLEFHRAIALLEATANTLRTMLDNYKSASGDIEETEKMLAALSKEGLSLEGSKKLLASARELMEKGEYEKAAKKAAEARGSVEPLFRSYFKARELRDKVLALVDKAGGLNLLNEEQTRAVNKMNGDFSIGNYTGAAATAEELIRTLEGELSDYRNVVDTIEALKEKMKEAERLGIDVSGLDVDLMTALGYVENAMFQEAGETAAKVEERLDSLMESYEEAESQMRLVRAKVRVMEREGINMSSIKPLLAEAEERMKAGDYGGAVELAKEIVSMCRETQENYSLSRRRLETISQQIGELEAKGVNTMEIKEQIIQVQEYLHNGNYTEARRATDTIAHMIKEAEEMHAEAMEKLRETWSIILDVAKYNTISVEEILLLRDDVATLIKDGAYREAIRESEHLRKLAESKGKTAEVMYRYAKPIKDTWKRLEQRGIKVPQNILVDREQFDSAMETEDLAVVEKIGKTLLMELTNLERDTDELVELVGTAQTKLSAARNRGIPVEEAERIFSSVTESWRAGDFETAKEGAKRVIEILLKEELKRGV